MYYSLIIILLILTFISVNYADSTIVELPNGKIRGSIALTSRHKVKFWAFQEIPYAAPPVGNLRFQPPQPKGNWSGILDATRPTKLCYQTTVDHKGASEDCLYLHIYTPTEPGTKNLLAVVLNIHGGTFRAGRGYYGLISPQFLMEHGVVVVSINYRLGPFGFLSTNDAAIPGNAGLKDQLHAIKWTKDNIHLFGGDPNKITIMGQSAGSASVSYQLLNSKSKGLFRGAIAQSGSALNTWAFQRHPVDTAYGIAALIDPSFHRNRSSQELLKFLQSVDAEKIHATHTKYNTFAPVIEEASPSAMITEPMYQAAANGRFNIVPYLGGICSEEGIIVVGSKSSMETWKKQVKLFDENIRLLVDEDLYINNSNIELEVGKKIKEIYTNKPLLDDIGASIQYQGDNRYMKAPIKFVELISQYTDVYFYQFSYHGVLGGNNHLVNGIDKVGHGEDLNYLWDTHANLSGVPEKDLKISDIYVGMLTNFVKYLNPVPKKEDLFQNLTLPKVTPKNFYYLNIDENLSIKENPRNFSFPKWVDIFEKYARKPLISF